MQAIHRSWEKPYNACEKPTICRWETADDTRRNVRFACDQVAKDEHRIITEQVSINPASNTAHGR